MSTTTLPAWDLRPGTVVTVSPSGSVRPSVRVVSHVLESAGDFAPSTVVVTFTDGSTGEFPESAPVTVHRDRDAIDALTWRVSVLRGELRKAAETLHGDRREYAPEDVHVLDAAEDVEFWSAEVRTAEGDLREFRAPRRVPVPVPSVRF